VHSPLALEKKSMNGINRQAYRPCCRLGFEAEASTCA